MAKIQIGNLKLIHIIEINQYQKFVSETTAIMQEHVPKSNPFSPLINHELTQIQDIIDNIKIHRSKRSLNFIGSAWKWIAGNPDHDDVVMMENKMNDVLENNNHQVLINKEYSDRINKITNVTNEILNYIKKDKSFERELTLSFQYKIKLIKEELLNTIYAIELSKSNTVSSNILSKTEISLILDKFNKDNIPYINVEQALKFSEIKIAFNESSLLYIINIPRAKDITYEKLIIKPIKRKDNFISKIQYNSILKKDEQIFGILKNCKTIDNLSLCKENNIIDISNDKCIGNLLKSKNATCNITNSQHIPEVEEISPGIILLNNFKGKLEDKDTVHQLNGTYLVKLENASITINNQKFVSQEVTNMHALPPLLQTPTDGTGIEETLSLEWMKELHINNTKEIRLIKTEKNIHQGINYTLLIFVLLTVIAIKLAKRNREIKTPEIITVPTNFPIETTTYEINPRNELQHHNSIYNIPYF